jgi:maleylacetate reductase
VEALYAEDANPVVSLMAEEAIRALGEALPVIVRTPDDKTMRSRALDGAWLARTCLGSVGMALHHKLCHKLGGNDAASAGPLLFELNRALGIAAALAQIGMPEEGLDEAADLAQVLMCAHHSALFRFEDGHCIEGPCAGANLDAVQVAVDNAARIILKQ